MQSQNLPPAETAPRDPIKPHRFLSRVTSWFAQLPRTAYLRLRRTVHCPRCQADLSTDLLYRRLRVCGSCGYHFAFSARERIHSLVDPHSFHAFKPAIPGDSSAFRRFQRLVHLREAVITGTASLGQQTVVIAAFDFRFHGGSMSIGVGETITRALEYATEHRRPMLAVISTGGVRIQEGMPALLQMAKTTQAAQEFQSTGFPFIAVLCNPTTGGVYASFANLADILLAEPGAVIGFAGPRVAQALLHTKMPVDSHRAESAYANGMIDAIVPRANLRDTLTQILALTCRVSPSAQAAPPSLQEDTRAAEEKRHPELVAWEAVVRVRRADRPTAFDYIRRLFSNFVELHGDRLHGDDPAIVGGLGQFENQPVVVIAQERGQGEEHHRGSAGPDGYRKAERLMRLAERLHLPLVTLIDTPGADPSPASELGGIANAVANCLATLIQVRVPTISLIIGEGTSGGALALAVTDRVLMLEHATFMVISPEGASAILFGDASHASETAGNLVSDARDLLRRGIVDRIVPEPAGGAHVQPEAAIENAKKMLSEALAELRSSSDAERLNARRERYRQTGRNAPSSSTGRESLR